MQILDSLNACFKTANGTTINEKGCGWKELGPIVNQILKNLLEVGIIIAVLMIMYAGYVLVKGQGSPAARTKAKDIFAGICIGLFLLVASYYIVDFVLTGLGVNDEYRKDSLIKTN